MAPDWLMANLGMVIWDTSKITISCVFKVFNIGVFST